MPLCSGEASSGVPLAFWDEWQKQSCQLLGEQKEQPVLTMLVTPPELLCPHPLLELFAGWLAEVYH